MTKRTSQNDSGCVEFLRNAVKTLGDLSKDGGPSPRNITLAYETASGVLREIERLRNMKTLLDEAAHVLIDHEGKEIGEAWRLRWAQRYTESANEPLENQNGGG